MRPEEPASALDRHLARFLSGLTDCKTDALEQSVLLLGREQAKGNTCLSLKDMGVTGVKADALTKALLSTGLVGKPGGLRPLILDEQQRLYLRRYWEYEKELTEQILRRVRAPRPQLEAGIFRDSLRRLFPGASSPGWQKLAAFNAVASNFSVITGGPGTGKTRTVVAILALLLEQARGENLRIALAAPSGKAAARLAQSIELAKSHLDCADAIKEAIPTATKTIHRLLGTLPDSPYFRHHEKRPLSVDVVIVDEASMVDLALMSKLFQAIPAGARIILLGDKDQLTSVEAGYVLGDICNAEARVRLSRSFGELYGQLTGEKLALELTTNIQPLQDGIIELKKNYRFSPESGIYTLSEAINRGAAEDALNILKGKENDDITFRPAPVARALPRALHERVVGGYREYLASDSPAKALQQFAQFQILCAVRLGPYGVREINRIVAELLGEAGLLGPPATWYRGRPVLIERNDYNLKLFNGDIGLAWNDPAAEGELRVFFAAGDGGLRRFLPARLPPHETVFAMTVHKSQGSEFARVLLILPEKDSPLLTRELLYTAVTRVREHVEVWAPESVLRSAIERRIIRSSGLRDALWGTGPSGVSLEATASEFLFPEMELSPPRKVSSAKRARRGT